MRVLFIYLFFVIVVKEVYIYIYVGLFGGEEMCVSWFLKNFKIL